jgi:hypothetical protein
MQVYNAAPKLLGTLLIALLAGCASQPPPPPPPAASMAAPARSDAPNASGGNAMGMQGPNAGGPGLTPYTGGAR